MRWLRRISVFSALAVSLVCSCARTEDARPGGDYTLRFMPVFKDGSVTAEDFAYGVWAYVLSDGKNWSGSSHKASALLEDEMLTNEEGTWTTDEAPQWPFKKSLSFFAYAPYDCPARFSADEGIVVDNYTAGPGKELFFCSETDKTGFGHEGAVTLPMRSALCKVEYRMESDCYPTSRFVIRGIRLERVALGGRFASMPEPHWDAGIPWETVLLLSEPVTLYGGSSVEIATLDMIPQISDNTLVIEGDFYPTDTSGFETLEIRTRMQSSFAVGMRRTYTFSLQHDRSVKVDDSKYIYEIR